MLVRLGVDCEVVVVEVLVGVLVGEVAELDVVWLEVDVVWLEVDAVEATPPPDM